jgi:predicted amidohydrolase YtcJ
MNTRSLMVMAVLAAAPARAQDCEIVLHGGKVATMDERGTMATSVTIKGDRITAVGTAPGVPPHDACAALIDLGGRTVLPGLIDSHNHIVQLSLRPGHERRIEIAATIADAQATIRAGATSVPAGGWITSIGGWSPNQLAEKRMPTLAELDAAAPRHPVYLQTGFNGPAATNSQGRAFLTTRGVAVGADGSIASGAATLAALGALRSLQTFEDRKRGALDAMKYAASLGLTMSVDKGGSWPATVPGAQGLAQLGNGAANEIDPFTGYDHFVALNNEGSMPVRLRIFYYMQDLKPELPFLTARFNNQYPGFGNDYLRISGVGERIHAQTAPPEVFEAAVRLTAERGWAYDQHTQGPEDQAAITAMWEKLNATIPLAPLRWCLAHMPGATTETLMRLKALGVGVSAAGGRYLAGPVPRTSPDEVPPFRRLVDSGIRVGYGSDGGTVAPLNPWAHIYYMVTGKNNAGELVAAGQTLTRVQALRMYTSSQPWFTRDEQKVGSIEPGKLADVVVLSADVLDAARVPDEAIRKITSALTIVGGKVVHQTDVVRVRRPTGR